MRISTDVRERERLLNKLREAVALQIASWDAGNEISRSIDCEPELVHTYVPGRAVTANDGMDLTLEDLDDLLGIGTPGRVIVGKPLDPNRRKPRLIFDDPATEKHETSDVDAETEKCDKSVTTAIYPEHNELIAIAHYLDIEGVPVDAAERVLQLLWRSRTGEIFPERADWIKFVKAIPRLNRVMDPIGTRYEM
jgi:hypothetical protein